MENKKVLLSVKDLEVKFRVRGRILTAIRGVSLDFHENESVAIVGESGSGKSVFTKTFAGMLETNGYISNGSIIFNDEELADTSVVLDATALRMLKTAKDALDRYSKLEAGSDIYKQILELESEKKQRATISEEEEQLANAQIDDLVFKRTELFNQRQTVDSKNEKERYHAMGNEIAELDKRIKELQNAKAEMIKAHQKAIRSDSAYLKQFDARMSELKSAYAKAIDCTISDETKARNEIIAKEMMDQLCLDMSAKKLATDSVSLYIGYSYTYGVPGVGGTAQLSSETNAASVILPAIGALYRRIVNPAYGIRRVCLSCNNVVADHGNLQLNMFEDATKQLRNKALQETMLEIRYKYGKNSILRGISYTPASTARERNNQIGGHKSGNEDSKGTHAKVKTG